MTFKPSLNLGIEIDHKTIKMYLYTRILLQNIEEAILFHLATSLATLRVT